LSHPKEVLSCSKSTATTTLAVEGYVSDVVLFARWLEEATGETFSAQEVTALDVREYVSYLTAVKRQKPADVARKVRALNNFFDSLVGMGRLKANPVVEVRRPKESRRLPKSLTDQELYRLRRWFTGPTARAPLQFSNCLPTAVSGHRSFVPRK